MQTNQLEAKMKKQIGVSLQALEWFILHGFIKNIVEDEEKIKYFFTSADDVQAIEGILFKLQKQFAPHLEGNCADVENIETLLGIKTKELHVKTKKLIV
jgi:hypothetical protein